MLADHAADAEPKLSAREVLGPNGIIAKTLDGYESRPEQLRVAARVERAIEEHEHAAIEAGTGIGKSLAYLVPAILSGKQTIVSTADKSLQAQIVNKDIPFLQEVMPVPFRAVLMKGRANFLCRYKWDKVLDEQQLLYQIGDIVWKTQDAELAWDSVQNWAESTESGDVDELPTIIPSEIREAITTGPDGCLGSSCPAFRDCYTERRKAAARDADVIIVNHALLIRDLVLKFSTHGHVHVLPAAKIIVIDEAHQLPDSATSAIGVELTFGRWVRLAGRIKRATIDHKAVRTSKPTVSEMQVDVSLFESQTIRQSIPAQQYQEAAALWQRVEQVEVVYKAALAAIEKRFATQVNIQMLGAEAEILGVVGHLGMLAGYLDERPPAWLDAHERKEWRKLVEQLDDFALELRLVATPGTRDFVRYAELAGRRLTLYLKPVEVADALRKMLWHVDESSDITDDDDSITDDASGDDEDPEGKETRQGPVVISCSATLANGNSFQYWRERVGLDDGSDLHVGSPFDYANHALLYLPPNGDLLNPNKYREEGNEDYFDRLATEYDGLVRASEGRAFCLFSSYRALQAVYDRIYPGLAAYLVLKQGEAPRPELVRQFKANGHAILFGVKSFWEGVDVQGEALSLVAIDKLPFIPPGDPVWDARKAIANERADSEWGWFDQLAIPAATIALKQGFGRLIRSKTDRGVIALLDGRLTTKAYGKRIVKALPPAMVVHSLNMVKLFYAGELADVNEA